MQINFYPEVLLSQTRNGLTELEYSGFIVHCDSSKNIKTIGNPNRYPFFQRSCAKPMQASLITDFDTKNYYSLTSEEIALCCGSHTGEPVHLEILRGLLKRAGLSEKNLKCPAVPPLNKEEQKKFSEYSPLHNNCSGKHTLMLLLCRQNGWDIETYLDFEHPLQKHIYKRIQELCETESELPATKDGCGAPNWALPLEEQAIGFLNLFCEKKYAEIKKSFLENPYMIGGYDRQDTDIITYTDGIAAKAGAGGLLCIVNTEKHESLMIKVIDADMKARIIIAIELLKQLNWADNNSIKHLLNIYPKNVLTENGEYVGEFVLQFSL